MATFRSPFARHWFMDASLGMALGLVVGAIVAVNIVIYAGPDDGYQSTIGDVFDHRPAVGVAALASVIIGPAVGVVVMRRRRRRTNKPG